MKEQLLNYLHSFKMEKFFERGDVLPTYQYTLEGEGGKRLILKKSDTGNSTKYEFWLSGDQFDNTLPSFVFYGEWEYSFFMQALKILNEEV